MTLQTKIQTSGFEFGGHGHVCVRVGLNREYEDKNIFDRLFIYLQWEMKRVASENALLCNLMWVHIVLHVILGMILLQIIVIGDDMDVVLARVLRILDRMTGLD